MSAQCLLQNDNAVCSKHKSEVCGVCCSDYALFNKLRNANRKDVNTIHKEITLYFKTPKNIARAGAKRFKAPGLDSLLKTVLTKQKSTFIQIITLSGFMCFTARFFPENRTRIANILQMAVNTQMNINQNIKQDKKQRLMHIKKRKQKRKEKMKEKQIKKQNDLKQKGIYSRIKNQKADFTKRSRNGEVDVCVNVLSILSLLTESDCKQYGTFFKEFDESGKAMNNAENQMEHCFDHLNLEERKEDDLIHLNDSQIDALTNAHKFMEFSLKYGRACPCDDPSTWNNQKIDAFLMENNIVPKPKPSRDIMIKIAKELIDLKSKLLMMLMSMPDDDKLAEMGKGIVGGNRKLCDDYSDDSENSEKESTFNIVVDAQDSISMDLNPFALKPWNASVGAMFAIVTGSSLFCNKITTKPFMDLQQSFLVIARSMDKYESIKDVPMFVVQDKEQTQAISIIVIGVKRHQYVPLICVKYFEGKRSNSHVSFQNMVKEVERGSLMQAIPADLVEVKLMSRVLKKNRNKLMNDVVKQSEKQWAKGWRLSGFMPYHKGEKKCPSCGQLAKLLCKGCKKVAYCCKKCQKMDWKLHKKICHK